MIKKVFSIGWCPALLVASIFSLLSCNSKTPTPMNLAEANLIPQPVSLLATGSSFEWTENTKIYVGLNTASSRYTEELIAELQQVGQYLGDWLSSSTGFNVEVLTAEAIPKEGNVYLALLEGDAELGEEGYELEVTEDLLQLTANQPAGLFYGIQTIRQLLPARTEKSQPQAGPWEIATGTIRDYPSYVYRGSMLDVARHFFGVEDVQRYIDLIAAYKLNVLHLHLSDDQGWRIEIKSWPKLATHGGSTEVGGGQGGYYTQDQYRELVRYAADRYITIVPEIDMPGHTNAALASYPELNCNGKAPDLYTGIEVGFSTLCTSKEITYQFVDDVVRELAAITPGPYLHVGGDESHVTAKEDYIAFINRTQDIVNKYGKQMIGWDEVALAQLKPGSVAQYWAKAENALTAVEKGAKLILSPATRTYLDMQYDSTTALGLHWAAYIEIDSAYIWDPARLVAGVTKEDILGIEAPLWSETLTTMNDIEYMAFPRLVGHAEIAWTPASKRNWTNYQQRLAHHGERFKALGINYYSSRLVPWINEEEPLKD